MYFAADLPNSIQIGTLEAVFGIGVILIGMGIAWGTLKTNVRNIKESVDKIESAVNDIRTSMTDHEASIAGLKAHTKYGVSNSPMQPNDEGSRLLEESRFNEQYPKLKDKLFELIDQQEPRTLYDYEVGAYEALKKLTDDPLVDPIKDYVVNHPNEPLELVFKVGSWVVRDDYAEYKKKH